MLFAEFGQIRQQNRTHHSYK